LIARSHLPQPDAPQIEHFPDVPLERGFQIALRATGAQRGTEHGKNLP
jgi:hypothetical protein